MGAANTDVWVIDAGGGPLTKISDARGAGQLAALVSRRPDDRVRQRGPRSARIPKIWLARGRRRTGTTGGRGTRPDSDRTALGRRTAARCISRPASRGRPTCSASTSPRKRALQVTTGERTVHAVDVNEKTRAADLSRQRSHASRRCVRRRPDGSHREAAHASQRGALEAAHARRRSSACRSRAPTAGTSTASS